MHLGVDTESVRGVAAGLRDAAAGVAGVGLPGPPPCEDLPAADAIRALLDACEERLDALAATMRAGAVLLETARQDYARADARAVRSL
jgi:hypothetical protein